MEEEEEIETELSTKKKHPPPSQTEHPPHSMNSSFKTFPPFPVSSSRSKKKDREKHILEVFKKIELNISLFDQANFQICQILEEVVYYQESLQAKRS